MRFARALAASLTLTPTEYLEHGLEIAQDGVRRNVLELLAYPGTTIDVLAVIWPELSVLNPEISQQLEHDARYAGYINRQNHSVMTMRREESRQLESSLNYRAISGLSAELLQKLATVQPRTMGQAARIDGMTPAALALVLVASRRQAVQNLERNDS